VADGSEQDLVEDRGLVANAPISWMDWRRAIMSNRDMSELLIVQTLTAKRAEILGRIRAHESQIAQAKHDLAHVNAKIEMFAAPNKQRVRYMVSHGFFRKGEITDICVLHRHLRTSPCRGW
jgi:hypothetical protein